MSQELISRVLRSEQIEASIAYNKNLNLSEDAIRLLQTLVCEEVTGKMDRDTALGLMSKEYAEIFLRTAIAKELKATSFPRISDSWGEALKFIGGGGPRKAVQKVLGQLGRLNRETLWAVLREMTTMEAYSEALVLAASCFQLPLMDSDKVMAFRYDPNLSYAFLSQIILSDIIVHPGLDSQRSEGVFKIDKAPQRLLSISFGPQAFESLDALKQAIRHALDIEVANLEPAPRSELLSQAKKKKRLETDGLRFHSKKAIQLIKALGGFPAEGIFDASALEAVAYFQKKQGLSVDGAIGPNTLKKMRDVLKQSHLHEGWPHLLIGYFSLWEGDMGVVIYESLDGRPILVDETVPGFKIIRINANTFDALSEELAPELFRGLSPLMEYKGEHFTGPHSAMIDAAFLPAMERINAYAGKFGVKVYVSGPSAASFRAKGTTVSGSIVPPSEVSNHKIGHAIDMNLIEGSKHYNSKLLHPKNASIWPEGIRKFIEAIQEDDQLRWGGDFKPKSDPVHIDDGTNVFDRSRYKQRYFAVQLAAEYLPGGRDLGEELEDCTN